jgi:hypothetical protein
MLNRYLSLLVAAVAAASSAFMLFTGAHPAGAVTLGQRLPCIGLAVLALALAVVHLRVAPTRSVRAEAAMWSGLAFFFVVAAFAAPHIGLWGIVAALSLAATSVARLVARHGQPDAVAPSPFRRRIFA